MGRTPQHADGDDDGAKHYWVLGVSQAATADDIKQAYRSLARTLHPDKGGSSAAFAALQTAFETLVNPKTRAVYDALAADVRFRPGAAAPYQKSNLAPHQSPSPAPGVTEALLLQQLLAHCNAGAVDPTRQLCVTCEVCRRPATKECWTCGMPICEFCTRRQHLKGSFPLHWPLVNSPGRMVEQLGKQELELKRKEDGQAYKASLPGYRPQSELLLLRQFQDAIIDLLTKAQQRVPNSGAKDTTYNASHSSRERHSSQAIASTKGNSNSDTRGVSGFISAAPAAATLPTGGIDSRVPKQFGLPRGSGSNALALSGSSSSTSSNALVKHGSSSNSSALVSRGSSKPAINRCLKAWLAAPAEVLQQLQGRHANSLSRFYMWAQTQSSVLLAMHVPTGGTSNPPKLDVEATSSTLRVQHQGFAPALYRAWANPVDTSMPLTSWASADGQRVAVVVPKANPGQAWCCCFRGDSYGARCLQSPYNLLQLPHEVQLQLPLPFWVDAREDVEVAVQERSLCVAVDGVMQLQRTYWWDEAQAARRGPEYKVVIPTSSSWCVEQQEQQQLQQLQQPQQHLAAGFSSSSMQGCSGIACSPFGASKARNRRPDKQLTVTLALPDMTQEEVQYKKGVRQNNAAATRGCSNGHGKNGCAFFLEDEDEFGLQCVLQALQFLQQESAWVGPAPWDLATAAAGSGDVAGMWVNSGSALPAEAQQQLKWLRGAKQGGTDSTHPAGLLPAPLPTEEP